MRSRQSWRQLLAELKRRHVFRVAAVYATTAFVVIQVAALTFERLTLPSWTVTLVIVMALLGFPLAVVLAWAFEVTPGGVRRTGPAAPAGAGEGGDAGGPGLTGPVLAVAAGLALLGAGGWWLAGSGGGTPAVERVAVLPLANLTDDPDQAYFVQGMHDGLISELQQAGVPVIARTSVMRFGDGETPIREIARELDVDAVVEGTVFRAGDSVQIDARLVDPSSEEYMWRASFGGSLRNVVALHRRMTGAIAEEIRAAIAPEDEARLEEASPVDPDAYDAYLRGVFHAQRFTAEDLDRALEYFGTSLEIDSTYAPAYAGIARVWGFRAQAGLVPARRARRESSWAVERARELGGALAESPMMATGAGFTTWREWDFEAGEAAFRRAIRINPRHPETRIFYGHLLTILGRWEEARAQAEAAVELDPLNPFVQGLHGTHLVLTRRYAEGIEVLEEMFRTAPGAGFGRKPLMAAYHMTGRHREALRVALEAARARGEGDVVAALERGRREGGHREALLRAADTLAVRAEGDYVAPTRVADLYAMAGEPEKAMAWLERGFEAGDQNLPYVGVRPVLEGLHDRPRFRELARRVGVPILSGPPEP